MREETPISAKKILVNIKHFWWICACTTCLAVLFVAMGTWREYRANQMAALRDTYQADSMIYFPTANEDQARTLMTVLNSQQIISGLNEVLTEQGMAKYDSSKDKSHIEWKGNCFPITLISEGEERTRLISEYVTENLLNWVEEHIGGEGQVVNQTTLYTCIELATGNVLTYKLGTERRVQLSMADFLGWKKIMVICAGFLCGCALIFVLLIFDTKLRTKKEVESICKYPCFGLIRKAAEEEVDAAVSMIKHNMDWTQNRLLLVQVTENQVTEKIKERGGSISSTCQLESCIWSKEKIDVMNTDICQASALMVIQLNKDTVDSIEEVQNELENLHIKIIGYVITEG